MRSHGPGLTGICHVCEFEARKRGEHAQPCDTLKWCGFCGHWIGDCCRYTGARLHAALRFRKEIGCCGPLPAVTAERMAEAHG